MLLEREGIKQAHLTTWAVGRVILALSGALSSPAGANLTAGHSCEVEADDKATGGEIGSR